MVKIEADEVFKLTIKLHQSLQSMRLAAATLQGLAKVIENGSIDKTTLLVFIRNQADILAKNSKVDEGASL